ncbi:hypothetical protein D3C80_1601950 [compost metagenome]
MSTPGGAVQHIPEQGNQQNHRNDAIGEDGAADADIVAEKLENGRLLDDIL